MQKFFSFLYYFPQRISRLWKKAPAARSHWRLVKLSMYVNRLQDTKGSCLVWRPVIQISWQVLQLASKATSFPVQCPQPGTECMAWWFALRRGQQPLFTFAVDSVGGVRSWDLVHTDPMQLQQDIACQERKRTAAAAIYSNHCFVSPSPPELCASACTHVHGCPRKLSAIFS